MSAPRRRAATALRRSGGVLGAVVVLATGVAAADHLGQRTTRTEHTYAASAVVELVADGDVEVIAVAPGRAGNAGGAREPEVEVTATARTGFAAVEFDADASDDRLVVRHTCADAIGVTCTASLEVRVPEAAHVTVRSSSGDVTAVDLAGDVTAGTQIGDVVVDGAGGDVHATSGSGDVEVSRARGHVEATTDLGGIAVHDASADVLVRSGSGDVDVRDVEGTVDASTSLGAVAVRGVAGDTSARSGSGRVDVAGVLGDVRATTALGRVVVRSTGAPVALDIATAHGRTTIDAPTDSGAARTVHIRSGSGDVAYLGTGAVD